MLKIEWATELYPSKDEDNFGIAGDFAVVRLDELAWWLEAHERTPLLMPLNATAKHQNALLKVLLAELSTGDRQERP